MSASFATITEAMTETVQKEGRAHGRPVTKKFTRTGSVRAKEALGALQSEIGQLNVMQERMHPGSQAGEIRAVK